jgi:Tfp pilus assembly protein PilV
MLALARAPGVTVTMGFIGLGVTVLTLSCVVFVVSVLAFVTPYGVACLRTASAMRRSMLGYAGWARFTVRQRSSAAP